MSGQKITTEVVERLGLARAQTMSDLMALARTFGEALAKHEARIVTLEREATQRAAQRDFERDVRMD